VWANQVLRRGARAHGTTAYSNERNGVFWFSRTADAQKTTGTREHKDLLSYASDPNWRAFWGQK
jgi:hypothetical protein